MNRDDIAVFRASVGDTDFADFREHVGRTILKVEMTPLGPGPIICDVTVRGLPDLAIATGTISPMITHHPATLGDDALILAAVHSGTIEWRNPRGSLAFGGGDAVLTSNAEAGTMIGHTPSRLTNIRLDRQRLDHYAINADAAIGVPIPASHYALRLLFSYADTLRDPAVLADAAARSVISRNIYDLAALALGSMRDPQSAVGGVRAARLAAARGTMRRHYHEALPIGSVAAMHGISASYLRQLFAEAGTSFADQLQGYRLEAARRILSDPLRAQTPISSVAYEVGFGDLSHFNRTFKRRFGATPSEGRAMAIRRS